MTSGRPPGPGSSLPSLLPALSHRPQVPRGDGLAEGGVIGSWDPEVFRPGPGYPAIAGFNFSDDKYRIQPGQVPGMGFKKPDCGSWVRKVKSGDQVRDIFHSCNTLGCPVCVDSTITRKAREASERFEHYEQAKLDENAALVPGEYRRAVPRAVIFTMSPGHIAELWMRAGKDRARFLDLARAEYNEILLAVDLVGGVTVYHENRVRHPDTGLTGKKAKTLITREAMLAGNMKDDSPSHALYGHIRKQKNPSEYYHFSPHFHFTGYGTLPPKGDFDQAFPGWTYHNKGNVPNVGGLLRYLFSHMAMIEDRQAVTWTGRLSRAVLGTEEIRTRNEPVLCQETGLPWVIIESLVPGEVGMTWTEPVTDYRAFFRSGKARGPPDPFKALKGPGGKRSSAPSWIRERGILAMAAYCDEWGRK